jgi:ribosomal protein S27AE
MDRKQAEDTLGERQFIAELLAAWRCSKCGYASAGFVAPNDLSTRYCRRCGTPMNEIHRESFA